jgi:hypothetical protein
MTQEEKWAMERHRAEVRMLLRRLKNQGRHAVKEYLDDPRVAGRREQLRTDLNTQKRLGNSGAVEEWK